MEYPMSTKIYRITAPILLAVFVITSCSVPTSPMPSPNPSGGDLRFVFLDATYQPTIVDTGRMVMFVENYADAEGVLIMAEMPGNHIDNGVIVRVINSNNNSLVRIFDATGN
jgi:hypothetical protein